MVLAVYRDEAGGRWILWELLEVDDVVFCEMWRGIVPSLALRCGFSGLRFQRGLYTRQISRFKTIPVVPHKAVAEVSKIGNL